MVTVLPKRPQLRVAIRRTRWPKWATQGWAVLAESRPVVQLVFFFRVLAGSGVVRHPSLHRAEVVGGWVALTIAIYVFNGITDITGDVANGSGRPIAAGDLTVLAARSWCLALVGVALALCCVVGPVELGLAIVMLCLGWAYSAGPSFKDAPAGFAVVIGGGAGLTYAAGLVARGHARPQDVAIAGALAVWVGTCCAAKDFSDVDGDRLAGRRTWPVVFGARGAARLLGVLAVAAAGCVLGISLDADISVVPADVVAVGSAALAVSARRHGNSPDRRARRRPYRVFMTTQYATNVALIVFVGG